MANVNKVFLIGRLVRDVELRYTPNGAAVGKMSVASNRTYATKDGEKREEVLYVDVTTWNREAEACSQYIGKGSLVHIEGHLKLETWDDKATGAKRSKIIVEAERVQFLDRIERPETQQTQTRPAAPNQAPANGRHAARLPAADPALPPAGGYGSQPEEEDDIPF